MQNPKSLYLMKEERYLIVAEHSGLSVIDIDKSQVAYSPLDSKDITTIVKLPIFNDGGQPAFVGLSSTGLLKLFEESNDTGNVKWMDTIKTLKAHQGAATDIICLPNGALISCGTDKTICFWEEKRNTASCGNCCNIM
jgi:WD40 repeat protein